MNVLTVKWLLALTCVGHLLLWRCDWIITMLSGGRFSAQMMKDNDQLAAVMGDTPLKKPMTSMVLGTFAMTALLPGYLALSAWMYQYSSVCAVLMGIGCILFVLPGIAHHVFCGAVEWFYLRMGKTENARKAIQEFFKGTASTMVVCYVGLLLFSVVMLIAVVGGMTTLPRWMGICNALPLFLVLNPLRIVGTGNVVNAVVALGLALML